MKMRISLAASLFTTIALVLGSQAGIAATSMVGFPLPLPTPRMESLDSTFETNGGTVVLSLQLGYNETGALIYLAGSTVDGAPADLLKIIQPKR
jgi:hypothetical protein